MHTHGREHPTLRLIPAPGQVVPPASSEQPGDAEEWVCPMRASGSALIIAHLCAFGLATPMSTMVGTGRGPVRNEW